MESWDGWSSLGRPIVEATVDEDESPTEVVISAVAAVSNAESLDLPPLYETLDPDALDRLFPEAVDDGKVTFRYDEYVVVVTADDEVEVYEQEGG